MRMAKRIDIGLPNQLYKRIEELAESAELKPTEVARLSLRHTLADPQAFLSWLNGDTRRIWKELSRADKEMYRPKSGGIPYWITLAIGLTHRRQLNMPK